MIRIFSAMRSPSAESSAPRPPSAALSRSAAWARSLAAIRPESRYIATASGTTAISEEPRMRRERSDLTSGARGGAIQQIHQRVGADRVDVRTEPGRGDHRTADREQQAGAQGAEHLVAQRVGRERGARGRVTEQGR